MINYFGFPFIFPLMLFFLPFFSFAADSAPVYRIHGNNIESYLEICKEAGCNKYKLPDTNNKDFYVEEPVFTLHDLDGDGVPEIVATDRNFNGAVNVRSVLYRINSMGRFEYIRNNHNGNYMYNVTFAKGKIISSFRDAGSWYDEIYSYANGKFYIELRDKNEVERTVFDENGKELDTFLLKEGSGKKWFEREMLSAQIKPPKAVLYNSPNFEDASKMYLVKGDIVILKNYHLAENNEVDFYLVEYVTAKNKKIIKWVKEEELSINQ